MVSPADVQPLAHQHPQRVSEGGPLALSRAVEVSRSIRQICLCSGMGETEEPPPEMHVLDTRNSCGLGEAVTFFHLSNKLCPVVSLEVILCFPT